MINRVVLCFVFTGLWGCGGSSTPAPEEPKPKTEPMESPAPEEDRDDALGLETTTRGTVVLGGTPEVPDALVERMSRYQNTRRASLGDVSPAADRILIRTRFGQTYQAHLVDRPGGAREQVTFRDEPVTSLSFVPGADAITYRRDTGGDEQYQLYRLDLDDRETTLLSDGQSRHGGYVWSHDGERFAYTSNARNGVDMDVYLSDGRDPASAERIIDADGTFYVMGFSRDDESLLVGEYISINESHLHLHDLNGGETTALTAGRSASFRDATFSPDGKTVYTATDLGGQHVTLQAIDVETKTITPLLPEPSWSVESIDLSPDGSTLAYVVNVDGYGELRLFDTTSGRELPKPDIPDGIVRGMSFAREAPVVAFTLYGPTVPGDAYTYDLRNRELVRWTESELGGLDPDALAKPDLVRYPTFDEREIPAFVYRPEGAGPHPVVVLIHGGPEGQARPYFTPLRQYWVNESGFALVVPNVRGSDGYGKDYLLLDNGRKREDSVKDIGALLDWIEVQPDLDASRVGVFGGSYGGYMVLASLVHYSDRIAAGVDYVGISNFVTFLENTKDYRRPLRRAEYGDESDEDMRAFLESISPSNQAHRISSALFVAHGANDPRVPLSETDQIVSRVTEQGHDVWYLVARDEGHGFRKKDNRDLFYQLTVLFFEKHLTGG